LSERASRDGAQLWRDWAHGALADALIACRLAPTERVFIKRHLTLYLPEGDQRIAELKARSYQLKAYEPPRGVLTVGTTAAPEFGEARLGVPLLMRAHPTMAWSGELPAQSALSEAPSIARYAILKRLPSAAIPELSLSLSSLWGEPLRRGGSERSTELYEALSEALSRRGQSAGLAALICALGCALSLEQRGLWAAFGQLDPKGEVSPVEELEVKLDALLKTGLDIERTWVPRDQIKALDLQRWEALHLCPISSVDELLEGVWSQAWERYASSPQLSPLEVARRALKLDRRQEHASAALMVEGVAALAEGLDPGDALELMVIHELVRGTSERYRGETQACLERHRALELRLQSTPRAVRAASLSAELEGMICLREASALISAFACREGLERCAPLIAQPPSQRQLLEALGLSARAHRLLGELDQAESLCQQQLTLYLRPEERAERSRCLYNLAQVYAARAMSERSLSSLKSLSALLLELEAPAHRAEGARQALNSRHHRLMRWRRLKLSLELTGRVALTQEEREALCLELSSLLKSESVDPITARAALALASAQLGVLGESCALIAWLQWLSRSAGLELDSSDTELPSMFAALKEESLLALDALLESDTAGLEPYHERLSSLMDQLDLSGLIKAGLGAELRLSSYPELIMAYHCLTLSAVVARRGSEAWGLSEVELNTLFERSLRAWHPSGAHYVEETLTVPERRRAALSAFCY